MFLLPFLIASLQNDMKPTPRLTTRWTDQVDLDAPHSEYPRPQLRRRSWVNLNGRWDFALSPSLNRPQRFGSKIIVPFPVESYLSGIERRVPDRGSAWYRRRFIRPKGDRILLHFEASDWDTTVWVNETRVGEHRGGYDPFSFDITDALKGRGQQEIVVRVTDPTDAGPQPRGKQVRRPNGIWYTPTTGIWQTVWLEPVPSTYVEDLKITPSLSQGSVEVAATVSTASAGMEMHVETEGKFGKAEISITAGGSSERHRNTPRIRLRVPEPEPWSPENPRLYRLKVTVGRDVVESYFAFREVGLGRDSTGRTRLLLNGKPYFMIGTLDQGFWPDGIYTAPTEAAMRYDLDQTKMLGFNMVRKHVKVEPRTWYAYCDKIGLLVWQDMPSGDGFIGPDEPDLKRNSESAATFERDLKSMVDHLYNAPSIVTWVLFNEGWGQYDTPRLAAWLKKYDPTRLLDATTGWSDRRVGDMHDIHAYPGPASPQPEANRAAVLGEFGGLGLPIRGHNWHEKAWGYQSFKDRDQLTHRFEEVIAGLVKLRNDPGCSAGVYTQTTDVETEANGLMTYDRAVLKMDPKRIRAALAKLTSGNK